MNLTLFLCVIFLNNATYLLAKNLSTKDLMKLLEMLKRRNTRQTNSNIEDDILETPSSEKDLPRAEPIKPGHSLIQPSLTMLESAVKYPQKDTGNAVYGNMKNLGLTYGDTNQRLSYGSFRKTNDLLTALLNVIENIKKNVHNERNPVVIMAVGPSKMKQIDFKTINEMDAVIDNDAGEDLDDFNSSEEIIETRRRSSGKKKSKFRDRDSKESESDDSSSSSRSSDFERNPGNPFTVHKDKYRQNWLWNHFMDGDHMNVNPYAPQFSSAGPSGASLFFGRKWWYFNQDDFKPLH